MVVGRKCSVENLFERLFQPPVFVPRVARLVNGRSSLAMSTGLQGRGHREDL